MVVVLENREKSDKRENIEAKIWCIKNFFIYLQTILRLQVSLIARIRIA
jgi:hypothetical protein